MAKKDKSKFKKRLKAQIIKEMTQAQSSKVEVSQPPTTPTPTIEKSPDSLEALKYIKKDLKKSAIIIGSMIAIIVILTVVDSKTNILLRFGDQIFKVLHIGG